MRRKKNKANKSVNLQVLPIVNPNAAGIDVGAKEHLVAVPCDRDPKPVRTFQAFTPELHELAAWLKRCGIQTIALESTGIYWISLYEVLDQYGFEIRVVNARHVKHVPGRTKTDVLDCQWIQCFWASSPSLKRKKCLSCVINKRGECRIRLSAMLSWQNSKGSLCLLTNLFPKP
jgi:hypothetical protein